MKRIKSAGLFAGLAATGFGFSSPPSGEGPARPNIILVMADDQGWGETSYNGHPVLKTPHLDAMAAAGLRFDRFYAAAPVCSPTRGSVLTGRHPNRFGCFRWGYDLRPQEVTVAQTLKQAGYATGHFGKWHIGSVVSGSPVNPGAVGFDEWFSSPNYYENDPIFSHQGTAVQLKGESSVVTAELALDFISRQAEAGKPFFAAVWFGSPHKPHIAADEFRALYSDQGKMADFYGEIAGIDHAVGLLRKGLEEKGLRENTLVWYCSDNGGLFEESSGGRGKKGMIYEGGLRVPAMVEWPSRVAPGRIAAIPAVTSDIYPTLLEVTGIQIPRKPPLDGISLLPLLEGRASDVRHAPIGFWAYERPGKPNDDTLMETMLKHQTEGTPFVPAPEELKPDAGEIKEIFDANDFAGRSAWLDWPWKLIRIRMATSSETFELYNLEEDPMERENRYPADNGRAASMRTGMEEWMRSVIGSLNGEDYR